MLQSEVLVKSRKQQEQNFSPRTDLLLSPIDLLLLYHDWLVISISSYVELVSISNKLCKGWTLLFIISQLSKSDNKYMTAVRCELDREPVQNGLLNFTDEIIGGGSQHSLIWSSSSLGKKVSYDELKWFNGIDFQWWYFQK